MGWVERVELRSRTAKTWRDTELSERHLRQQVLKTVLHYPSAGPDSEVFDQEVDWAPIRINDAELDGWISHNGWHYSLGRSAGGADGWVGFGGRQGQHWLQFRLLRVGYLHWPTRSWQDVGGSPTYERAKLSSEVQMLTLGPEGAEETLNVANVARWEDVWTTPGGGALDISWQVEGRELKEEVTINQAAREWMAANRPPTTPAGETWFGFVFEIDPNDIPKWVIDGVSQDLEGDFTDDDGQVELRDVADRLLAFMPVSDALSVEYQVGEETRQDTVQLRKRLWKQGGTYYLLVGARVDRLNGMHTGAITFDPTFTTQPGSEGKDTYLYVNNGNKHYGGDTGLIDDGTNYVMLIEFDCSSVPAGASCSAATLYLYAKVDKGAQTVTFHELTVANEDWLESNTQPDPGYGLTVWDHKIEESGPAAGDEENWAGAAGASTSGTDYLAGSIGAVSYAAGAAGTEGSGALTTGDVEDWFGASNQNYGLRGKRTVGGQQAIVCSSDHATAGWRPKLVIEYTSRIPRHPAVVYQCPAIY